MVTGRVMLLNIVGHQCCWHALVHDDRQRMHYFGYTLAIPDALCPEEDNIVQVHVRDCTIPKVSPHEECKAGTSIFAGPASGTQRS
ncbi:hypothetical protein PAXINDRAFT_172123 [Paxillus involutus ATCC 200175]|uniref:Uncharacterized protein n=1 Tax=Paxillus involutus ATCC 200175 TaxID=664439 RepID=A0A0C9TRQ4_PAXIN|nr:hypothetical protein PAXINDRAFT_172123 [Paxillus involutus ATCC 200175]